MFDRILKKLGLKSLSKPASDWPTEAEWAALGREQIDIRACQIMANKVAEQAQRNLIKECVREVLNEEKVANSIVTMAEGRANV